MANEKQHTPHSLADKKKILNVYLKTQEAIQVFHLPAPKEFISCEQDRFS